MTHAETNVPRHQTPSRLLPARRVFIHGGTGGIGKAISSAMIAEGASVAISARNMERLLVLKGELDTGKSMVHVGVCDMCDAASVQSFTAKAAETLGGMDVLVNCASSFSIKDEEESWAVAFQTDLMGAVRATNAAIPFLMKSDDASIVHFSSIGAHQASPDRLPYAALKAAVEQYTVGSAQLYAKAGVRVNCIVAGSTFFEGGIWDRIRRTDPDRYEQTRRRIPLGNFAEPRHMADAVTFLASQRASWITGQCIVVDGGQLAAGQ